jgi:hypothetical protein
MAPHRDGDDWAFPQEDRQSDSEPLNWLWFLFGAVAMVCVLVPTFMAVMKYWK